MNMRIKKNLMEVLQMPLALARDFADNGPIAVILGDNTTDASIKSAVDNFNDGAVIFLKKVPDPQRFGVPEFDPNDHSKIINIEEKPSNPNLTMLSLGYICTTTKYLTISTNAIPIMLAEMN